MSVAIQNQQTKAAIDGGRLERVAQRALRAGKKKKQRSHVNVLLVDDREIAKLHWRHMKIRGATDVMAFGMGEGREILGDDRLLGDVVVSVQTAKKNAKQLGIPLQEEVERYVVHGILHLFGYRDDTPARAKVMHKKQEGILVM